MIGRPRTHLRHVVRCESTSKPPLIKRIVRAIGLGTAVTGSCIFSIPYILGYKAGLTSCTKILSACHPRVGVSLERADVGWWRPKPTLEGLVVYDKAFHNKKIFSSRAIRGSESLFDVVIRRRDTDVFIENPTIELTEMLREASSLADDRKAASAFSAEFHVDDRINIYLSDGTLDMTETVCAMLDGRLFIDATDMHGAIVVEALSPGFHATLEGSRTRTISPSVAISTPVHVETKVTKSLSDVLLKRVNPLLAGGVDIHSDSVVTCNIQPDTGMLPSDIMHVDVSGYSFKIKQGKIVKDLLQVISTFSSDLRRSVTKDMEMVVTSSSARVTIDHSTETTTTDVERISIYIPGYRHTIDLAISGKLTGVVPDDNIDMNISISPTTLENILGIKGGPLVLRMRGSTMQPHILVQKAIIDLGLLVAQNM